MKWVNCKLCGLRVLDEDAYGDKGCSECAFENVPFKGTSSQKEHKE